MEDQLQNLEEYQGTPVLGALGEALGPQVGSWCQMNHAVVTSLAMVTSSLWPIEKPKLTARNT